MVNGELVGSYSTIQEISEVAISALVKNFEESETELKIHVKEVK